MKKQPFKLVELLNLGFIQNKEEELENGDFYICFVFRKNDSQIDVTYEYNSKDEFISGYIDFNCEKLQGRALTIKDIELLIEIM